MRLDGDKMAADADDGDAGHATGTYLTTTEVAVWPGPYSHRSRGGRTLRVVLVGMLEAER